jgi:hypothetical protein
LKGCSTNPYSKDNKYVDAASKVARTVIITVA